VPSELKASSQTILRSSACPLNSMHRPSSCMELHAWSSACPLNSTHRPKRLHEAQHVLSELSAPSQTMAVPMADFDDDAARAPAKSSDSPRRAHRKNTYPKPGPDDVRGSADRPPRRAAAANNLAVRAVETRAGANPFAAATQGAKARADRAAQNK
jgi:hypothetical protein